MFFQINITPKDKKASESITKAKTNNSYNLLLAPFQPPTRIKLDTKLNSSVECQLIIRNSNNRHLTVSAIKVPPEERCIHLSATQWSIEADSSAILNITWEPKEEGSWRDILQLSDSRRIKYDIPLILTSTNPNKGTKHKVLAKTTKRSSLVSRNNHMSVSANNVLSSQKSIPRDNKQVHSQKITQLSTKRTRAASIENRDKENTSHNIGINWMLNQAKLKKQRKEQSSPKTLDFSKFLDSSTFKFTPLKSKFTCFESSLKENSVQSTPQIDNSQLWAQVQESPIAVETKVQMTLRKETYITIPKFLNVPSIEVQNENGDNNEFDDSLSPKSTEVLNGHPSSEISALLNDIKFTPFKSSNTKSKNDMPFSPESYSIGNKSNSSKSLSEDSVDRACKNATFEIDTASSIEQNNTYELPKSPTSTKINSHMKPLCLAKTFDKNNLELEFSTPLPLHNSSSNSANDHARCSSQFSKSQIDFGSAKDCLEADLWVKCKNTSLSPISKSLLHSTLESIREEDNYSIESTAKKKDVISGDDSVEKRPNALCIEISPPKKHINYKPFVKKMSPIKSGKIKKDKPVAGIVNLKKKLQNSNTTIRSDSLVRIPGVKIAKLSLSKLNSDKDKSNSKKVKKQSKELSVKLHDPDDFLTMYCNPDPFAASMTQDPFLASTLYYDDKWIFIQELEFKKWLNALLTPPEHLSADVESAAIDVGKVWQCCRGKEDVILAETKESISARYHTNTRLNTLRKAACLMLRKPEVIAALSQTTVGIEKEILLIRPDKDLHRDIGLQKIILELFISYNPLWLRIGLETIYGETIPLQSNNDLIGLSRFLLNRFFSDPFIVKHHSASSHPNIRLASFQTTMNKFMLKKFLFLVYFLDYAKRNKLIGHDPCLFHKKALNKDSRSILLTFSREVLSGIGDVTKVLRNYNYVVSHKQTHLDEYDYAVTNLCTDLRDGVRLCRVMELVTGNRCLTRQCRVPAISRLQKVHNVSIALCTLKEAGYTITGDIDAKCIADGHREKSLSLLWQIIHKFQRPRFENAAKTLQRWWRSKLWHVRVKAFLSGRRHKAACVVQRAWRCRLARRKLSDLRQEHAQRQRERTEAARAIQSRWRLRRLAKLQRREYQLARASVLKIQRWWRRLRRTRRYVQEFERKRRLVVELQRRWRASRAARLHRTRYLRLKESANTIARLWRGRRLRIRTRAARLIQVHWRARLLGRRERARFVALRRSASCVQRLWRERRRWRACVRIQSRWRAVLLARRERAWYLETREATLRIQTWWRGRLSRKRYARLKWAAGVVGIRWRAARAGRAARARYQRARWAALAIQRGWRAARVGRYYRELRRAASFVQARWRMLRSRTAALVIQKHWRRKSATRRYQALKWAVRLLEQRRERQLAGRKARDDYLRLRAVVVLVQRRVRAKRRARRSRERAEAAVKIQRFWRSLLEARRCRSEYRKLKLAVRLVEQRRERQLAGRTARHDYLRLRGTVVLVQRRFRANRQVRRLRERRHAATQIQRFWRSLLETRRCRSEYRKLKLAVRFVERRRERQLAVRKARDTYLRLRATVVLVQRRVRHKRLVRRLRERREAAIRIQRFWRSLLETRRCQSDYRKLKLAVRLVERWREGQLAGRKARDDYSRLRGTVVLVQRRFRAIRQLRRLRERRQAAIEIQRFWRSLLETRRCRSEYRKLKLAVRFVERRREIQLVGRRIRERYSRLRGTVVLVQRLLRAKWQVRRLRERKQAATQIQRFWRSLLETRRCRSEYRKLKLAVRFVERRRERQLAGRKARDDYLRLRAVVVLVQRRVRAKRRARRSRERAEAAVKIQRFWRSLLEARRCRSEYRKLKLAVRLVEQRREGQLAGRTARLDYLRLRGTVVLVQRRFRANRQAEKLRLFSLAATKIQRFSRSLLEMRRRRSEYRALKAATIVLQRRYRARRQFLARQAARRRWAVNVIEDWWIGTSEQRRTRDIARAHSRRINGAALKIQAVWRGFKVRRAASKKLAVLRSRAERAAKAAVPTATLGFRLKDDIEKFKYASNIGQLSVSLASLDVLVRLLPNACVQVCRLNLVAKLYDILTQANRSLPWLDVCLKDVSILLTLAKFKPTTEYVLKLEYVEVLARLLTISSDKKEDLFLNTATLVWVLTENHEYAEAAKNCPRTKYLLQSLYTSLNKKLGKSTPAIARCLEEALPSPNPDWGLRNRRPRTFRSVSQAVVSLASRLNILNIAQSIDMQRSFNFSM